MNRAVVLGVGGLAIAVATVAAQAPPPGRLIVAFMNSDGELAPVARYDGKVWRHTWPEPIEFDAPLPVRAVGEIPNTWLDQPVPLQWTAWSQDTGQQQLVTVTGVDRDGSCFDAITLATSLTNLRSVGLAFDRPVTVVPIVERQESSPESLALRRDILPHFRRAITRTPIPAPGSEDEIGARVLALARADKSPNPTLILPTVFRDPRMPLFFLRAEWHFEEISSGTTYDALSYSGWFRRDAAGELVPISASVETFPIGGDRVPRYTPLGIVRLGATSIWLMSEWGIESQTIVLFESSVTGVRKLLSTLVSGC